MPYRHLLASLAADSLRFDATGDATRATELDAKRALREGAAFAACL
jgi:hypothetical protein